MESITRKNFNNRTIINEILTIPNFTNESEYKMIDSSRPAPAHLAARERQPPLPVGPTTQRRAAGQQIEARYGLFLCDFTVPEVVGSQPALGHGGPTSKRHHRQKVVQHAARACLQEGECGGILKRHRLGAELQIILLKKKNSNI